jgi:hypothetical protein
LGHSGLDLLMLSSSPFDPERTWAADFAAMPTAVPRVPM